MADRRLAGLVAVVAVALLATAVPARAAEEVTGAQLRELARRAERDPAARQELAEVRRVDGRPFDVRTALAGADEEEQRRRLRTLAGTGAADPPAVDAAAARDDARRILDGRRYNPAQPPRPLRGVLRRIGGWLRPVVRPIGELFDDVSVPRSVQVALGAAVLAVAVVVATRLVRRRTAEAVGSSKEARRRNRLDPGELEREAEEAERGGDLDAAVRLRFRAGLLRLDGAGVLELRPSLTTGEVRRQVPSETLHGLASTFEAVAYAGEHADGTDVAAARAGWPRVLEEVGRR